MIIFIRIRIFIIGLFHLTQVWKGLFYKNRPKFCRLAIIPCQKISRSPLKTYPFWHKYFEFCTPKLETPLPVLPQFTSTDPDRWFCIKAKGLAKTDVRISQSYEIKLPPRAILGFKNSEDFLCWKLRQVGCYDVKVS